MLIHGLEPINIRAGLAVHRVGAYVHDGGVTFRVWAPKHAHVRVATGDGTTTRYVNLERDAEGFFTGRDEHGRAGDTYWYQMGERLAPDPASRFQPLGVEGSSQVVDPTRFIWQARGWQRPALQGRVIYELHVGTFTREGTYTAAIGRLDALRDLGVNTIELMPLGDFAGRRNWGYDGVMLFAPAHSYGTPDQLRALIDAAHQRELAVIVDVVYNHLGPCGNVLPSLSDDYFHHGKDSLWGAGLNFDGPTATPVREFFLQNACMWFDDYRVDGLRLDAVHAIHDQTTPHLVAELAAAAHERDGFVIAEDERNDVGIITTANAGGWGADAMWADDFHHSVRVAITRQNEAHYVNYTGSLDEVVATLRAGWFYQGQHFRSWKRPRGTDCGHVPPEAFVFCISNHDQVGNRPLGDRLSEVISPEQYRALSVMICLVPYTPMLFMGQEWAASSPFPFFSDHPGEVGATIAQNRLKEFAQVGAVYTPDILARIPDPQAETTFLSAKLDWAERERGRHAQVLALYRECLHLRARHAIFQSPPRDHWRVEKIGSDGFSLHWRGEEEEWTLMLALHPGVAFVSPDDRENWTRVLSRNEPRFGGSEATERESPGAGLWRRAEMAAAPAAKRST